MDALEFREFSKIARLSREMIITEKIDGTNGVIAIGEDGQFFVGSRSRWLEPTKSGDNFGFCRWALDNIDDLRKLGVGYHYGEWWGQGIQRGYGLKEKRFSLFNVSRWWDDEIRPACCHVVPTLYTGMFDTDAITETLIDLRDFGSQAVIGYDRPEGIVIFHTASGHLYKKTILNDESPKSLVTA